MSFPKRGLANRVMGPLGGQKTGKREKAKQKQKRLEIRTKNDKKYKKDSDFDFQIRWIKP